MLFALKSILCNRAISLKRRLTLFNATVSSGVLWCTESWALRATDKQHLRVAQNRMLRKIVDVWRNGTESWVEWVIRSTRKFRQIAETAGIKCWISLHSENKWQSAGHVARTSADELVWKVSAWRDEKWQQLQIQSSRPLRARPGRWTRWEDAVRQFAGCHWKSQASDRETWKTQNAHFASFMLPGSRTV